MSNYTKIKQQLGNTQDIIMRINKYYTFIKLEDNGNEIMLYYLILNRKKIVIKDIDIDMIIVLLMYCFGYTNNTLSINSIVKN